MSKINSPLDLLDDGFESQLICSLFLKTCHQDEELRKMEIAVNYSNFLITGNYLRADYTPPTVTEAKVAAKLHGCLDVIRTFDTISSEEQSIPVHEEDGQAVPLAANAPQDTKIHSNTTSNDDTTTETKQQDTSSLCTKVKIGADDGSINMETIVYKITTPEIDQNFPLHRPQLITPEMQPYPNLPQDLSQDTNQSSLSKNLPIHPKMKKHSNNQNSTSQESSKSNLTFILPKPSNNNNSSTLPQKRKMIHEINEKIQKMNEIHHTQTKSLIL